MSRYFSTERGKTKALRLLLFNRISIGWMLAFLFIHAVPAAQVTQGRITPGAEETVRHHESGKAYLDFPVGVSAINPMFGDNAAGLQRIHDLINRIQDDPDADITGISITGYASPEGESNFNLSLSGRRASALAAHLKKIYGFPDNLFTLNAMGEDWNTLDRLVGQSTIAGKQRLLDIIRSEDNYDTKGKGLKEMADSVPYRRILESLFPHLRRCDIEVGYTVIRKR